MKQNIKNILISLTTALVVVTVALNVPVQWFNLPFLHQPSYGTVSLTTLNGTDNLTNFPTVYNANNAALNAGKEDISDLQSTSTLAITTLSSLSTVGTITSGTWHGNTITVPYGGTGSTTLSQYQVLLGNATGAVTTPSGWGTSGQFLTSNGAGALPSWTSSTLDTSQNFVWTGVHSFAGSATYIKNLLASSTITINTVPYTFPSTHGASSTVLSENGSGNVTWETASTTITQVSGTQALSTTLNTDSTKSVSCAFPASVIGGGYSGIPGSSANNPHYEIDANYPSANSTWTVTAHCADNSCGSGTLTVYAICLSKTP